MRFLKIGKFNFFVIAGRTVSPWGWPQLVLERWPWGHDLGPTRSCTNTSTCTAGAGTLVPALLAVEVNCWDQQLTSTADVGVDTAGVDINTSSGTTSYPWVKTAAKQRFSTRGKGGNSTSTATAEQISLLMRNHEGKVYSGSL